MFKRLVALLICFTFSFSNLPYVHAQGFSVDQLPVPGTMVGISAPFAPLTIKGLIVNPQKPLEFQFIVDTGRGPQDTVSVRAQADQLVKYFLAGLTIPEGDLWVNLSPYEKDRMVPEALGQTDLGRDLLAQDYILKQLTASLIYPEKDLGKEFWSRVYAKAQKQFGTTNVPVNTFNKVWILPDQAQVFENGNAAYVTRSTLKVMSDEDYLAKQKHQAVQASSVSSQVIREIVLPEIEKEVNTGRNFAPLRQIYQALILAKWYKEAIQNGLLDAVYTNKSKVAGVNLNDPGAKEEIYQRYLQAYKKGAFNYIKETSTPEGQVVPRKYFSGGITKLEPDHVDTDGAMSAVTSDGAMEALTVDLEKTDSDRAMLIERTLPSAELINANELLKEENYEQAASVYEGFLEKIDTVKELLGGLTQDLTDLKEKIEERVTGAKLAQKLITTGLTDQEIEGLTIPQKVALVRVLPLEKYTDLQQKFILCSGAPGSGKGALMDKTFDKKATYGDLVEQLLLYHTRNARKGEIDGRKYHFGSDNVGKTINRLSLLIDQGKIIPAMVNKQLQAAADKKFWERVLVRANAESERILPGDFIIPDGDRSIGDQNRLILDEEPVQYQKATVTEPQKPKVDTYVYRPINGLNEAFGLDKITVLEGGYDWYQQISAKFPDIFRVFLSPFTPEQVQLRGKNQALIEGRLKDPFSRFLAYSFMNEIRKKYKKEDIDLSKDGLLDRVVNEVQTWLNENRNKQWNPQDESRLMKDVLGRNANDQLNALKSNAILIESPLFIEEVNHSLVKFFKKSRTISPQEEPLVRALAYEVQMKLSRDVGRGDTSFSLEVPSHETEDKGDFNKSEDMFNRVVEGVIQILTMQEYEKDGKGAIVLNPFVYDATNEKIETAIKNVAADFSERYFDYLLKAISRWEKDHAMAANKISQEPLLVLASSVPDKAMIHEVAQWVQDNPGWTFSIFVSSAGVIGSLILTWWENFTKKRKDNRPWRYLSSDDLETKIKGAKILIEYNSGETLRSWNLLEFSKAWEALRKYIVQIVKSKDPNVPWYLVEGTNLDFIIGQFKKGLDFEVEYRPEEETNEIIGYGSDNSGAAADTREHELEPEYRVIHEHIIVKASDKKVHHPEFDLLYSAISKSLTDRVISGPTQPSRDAAMNAGKSAAKIQANEPIRLQDRAMLQTPKAVRSSQDLGGIDLNQINVNRTGKTVFVQFDQAQLNAIVQGGFEGFTPVIINITRISNLSQLLVKV